MLYTITHVPRHRYRALLERIHRWLRPGGWMLVNFGTKDSPAWLEEDFLGYGATSWTNGWDAEANLSLVSESGFHVGRGARVKTQEANGHEEWLWVLARRP